MPSPKVVTEEIQAKMAALYPKYECLQRDGSVSLSANEAQILLEIHKHLFGANFCTTCPPAILKAVDMCFRDYDKTEDLFLWDKKVDESIEGALKKYTFIGTNKQWKQLKQAFPELKRETELSQSSIRFANIKASGWAGWFKEV